MLWRYMVEDTLQIFRADLCHTAINLSLPNLLALRSLDLRLRTGVAGDLFFLNAIEHHLPKRRETVQRCDAGLTVPFQGWPEVLFNEIHIKISDVSFGDCETVYGKRTAFRKMDALGGQLLPNHNGHPGLLPDSWHVLNIRQRLFPRSTVSFL